jgi:hypothetical protein
MLGAQIPFLGSTAGLGTGFPQGGAVGIGNISILNGTNPMIRQFGEATFRLSGGPNIASAQPTRVLPSAPSFMNGLASIAESGGVDPLTGEFQGALGPIALSLRQASLGTALSLRGIL